MLASNPPLLQEELLLFVLTGAPPASGSAERRHRLRRRDPDGRLPRQGRRRRSFSAGGRPARDPISPSRLELQVGRETTHSGSATIDARLRLKKNFIAKGNTLYLTSEKDVYDQENLGLKMIFKFK